MADDGVVLNCESAALVQKSIYTRPGFYGDAQNASSTSEFSSAINACVNLAGLASSLQNRNAPRDYVRTPDNYILTQAEKDAIATKATQLSLLGFVPYDVLEKFFYILASFDNINDLIFVAQVMGIPELGDQRYIRNIRGILNIPDIYKVGFLAQGVASVLQAFADRYKPVQQNTNPSDNLLNTIANIAGAVGALAGPLASMTGGYAIGNFMSELVLGNRLTTQQIARNPSLTPPSYQGKAFFGENPTSIAAVDQLFCRRVGAFNKEQGSNGTVSFGFQNFGSFGGTLSLATAVTKMVMGTNTAPPTNTYVGEQMQSIIGNVASVLNVATNVGIEMRRSDNAIPFLIGLATGIAEETRCPFNTKQFTQGWEIASSVGNDLQSANPLYIEACRSSL